ncbi:hypothetical protein [Idiomarina loihiensis]|uniref:hypothetical protein n=1 Tax=Idiomarina loihiensis TaxID=135577 RepID=UPI00384FB94E
MINFSGKAFSNIIVGIFLILSPVFLSNVEANEINENLKRCAEINSDSERLSCLDKLIASLSLNGKESGFNEKVKLRQTEKRYNSLTGSAATARNDESRLSSNDEEASFGIENREKKTVVEKIYATVVKITKSRFRDTTYQLDNGQVWARKDSSRLKISEGDKVFIERGALTSFYMGRESQNTRIRVERL